jgi:hypothetical protein
MGERVIGVLMMTGSLVFAFLYDTGRWPAFWSVIEHGALPTNFGQVSQTAPSAPNGGQFPPTSGNNSLPGPALPPPGGTGSF